MALVNRVIVSHVGWSQLANLKLTLRIVNIPIHLAVIHSFRRSAHIVREPLARENLLEFFIHLRLAELLLRIDLGQAEGLLLCLKGLLHHCGNYSFFISIYN